MKFINWLICAVFGCHIHRTFFLFTKEYEDACVRCGRKYK